MRFTAFFAFAIVLMAALAGIAATAPLDIPDDMRACTVDTDCILADRMCGTCCDYDAIARDRLTEHESALARHCETAVPITCPCDTPDLEPVCRDNRCVTFNPFADEEGNVSYE